MVIIIEGWESVCVSYCFLVLWLLLMMFMQFFIWGSWLVILGLVMICYEMLLLIGDVFFVGLIVFILFFFVLGMLVDCFFVLQKVMVVMYLVGVVILWFVLQVLVVQNGVLLIGLLFGYMLCYMLILVLINNIVFYSLVNVDKIFLVVCVFGIIGWIIVGICIGVIGIFDIIGIFMLVVFCLVVLVFYSLMLLYILVLVKGMLVQFCDLLCVDVFVLLKICYFLIFFFCVILIFVLLGIYYVYIVLYLVDVGVKDVSIVMFFGQMLEIVFMLVILLLFCCFGVKYMLFIGMVVWFVCYVFFVFGVSEEGCFLFYLGILLYGVCYDFFFVVGFIYIDCVVGEKVKGQVQSMIVMFIYGIGMLLGLQIFGVLYNYLVVGQSVFQVWVIFWWILVVVVVVIVLIFFFFFQYNEKELY